MTEVIKVAFMGDLAIRRRFVDKVKSKDFALFGELDKIINDSDLSIINLETPLLKGGNPIPKSGPNISSPEITAKRLKESGIGLICLANNHIMDYGEEGLSNTLNLLTRENLSYTGVGANNKAAQKFHVSQVKDYKLAIINIAENEFGNATETSSGAASLNPIDNFYQISKAAEQADFVVVVVHGGHETFEFPSIRMRDTYRFFIDAGADAVIGHHTHCFSGYEEYKGKPIVYSLGNCIFDNGSDKITSWNYGVCAVIAFSDNGIRTKLKIFSQSLPGDVNPAPKLLSDDEQEKFRVAVKEKEVIIKNDDLLKKEFEKYVEKSRLKYRLYLEPTSNRYLLGLISQGIIKSLRDDKKTRLLTNIIRCEAHRDVLLSILTAKQ